ncbi:uncharacterized protein LOC129217395 [Uloborus diversus]|uniref:uncharacterized protein LOC129217395 n=1 Tax=Uloborus diversus TaxID=327109 RepID=UPI0024093F15|nr:uncharacterized protein LOC129217395 [Uloborus diversus]
MLPRILALAFFVGVAVGSPIANQYVDSVLHTALPRELNYARLNPVLIPGFETRFEDKIPIIGKVKGEASYSRGNLTGLAQVRRYSECNGPYYKFGSKIINCTLGFDRLDLTYEGTLKYGKLPKVDIKGSSNLTGTVVFIEVANGRLNNFLITRIAGLDVTFTGLGPLNKYTKFLKPDYIANAQRAVNWYITQPFNNALNAAFSTVPMPN